MDLLDRPVLRGDVRIPYGDDPSQFGDLWLPSVGPSALAPTVVFFHGGWWKSEYALGYAGYFCQALRNAGIAVWSVEYRRRGSTGGGWPATFQDAAAGFDALAALAQNYPLDASRVVVAGHSAGGHLAFWVAGRGNLAAASPLQAAGSRPGICRAIALAGAVDLRLTIELAGDGVFAHDRDEVHGLMGGSPEQFPDRYRDGNPGDLLPLEAPQVLIQGTEDDQIPLSLPERWCSLANKAGAPASILRIAGADHFDIVDPASSAWPEVLAQFQVAFASAR